ncbi:MAG TPA: peptidoglycan-binding protein [Deltaproteobacteria bacterium]|nr:peptidoglycan-binding protein [Deltaproteobacteria bacterium]
MRKMKRYVGRVLVFVLCCVFFAAFTAVAGEQSPAAKGVAKKAAGTQSAKAPVPNKDVMQIQEALNKEGFKLKVDGLMGPKTKGSLKKYQKKNGLKVTGKANKATLDKLLKKMNG